MMSYGTIVNSRTHWTTTLTTPSSVHQTRTVTNAVTATSHPSMCSITLHKAVGCEALGTTVIHSCCSSNSVRTHTDEKPCTCDTGRTAFESSDDLLFMCALTPKITPTHMTLVGLGLEITIIIGFTCALTSEINPSHVKLVVQGL